MTELDFVPARTMPVGGTGSVIVMQRACLPLDFPAGPVEEPETDFGAWPLWLAALAAAGCHARPRGGSRRAVRWALIAGRAQYTNFSGRAERIEPLDVKLHAGETLVVYWSPGETDYTLEITGSVGFRSKKCG